ncbi:MAG: methylated-DNA--[protein]-cysteine S-methyltransferase, partial [Rhodoferax sp.]|nr:methylated-DNA--[protein]-cysteine S-methyltransferase [Rhodoferax sp.]
SNVVASAQMIQMGPTDTMLSFLPLSHTFERMAGYYTAMSCGATIAYGTLGTRIGRAAAVRAVGAAVGRNPISIVVPCHRVVGANGSLTGYAGGLERKVALLQLERALVA